MIDDIIERICSIDMRTAAMVLARHLASTSPLELEALARERERELVVLLRDVASTQLRIVNELPNRLEQIAAHVRAPHVAFGVRLGLRVVLRGVIRHAEVVPAVDSEITAMLGPAYVLHRLQAQLQPWLPASLPATESELALEFLRLGVPDFMLPLTEGRIASSWACFHRLRALGPEVVRPGEDLGQLDDERLAELLTRPEAAAVDPPVWPGAGVPAPLTVVETDTLELSM